MGKEMTFYDRIQESAGFKKQSNNSWEGPCPKCGDQWRLIVWINKDIFKCQSCGFRGDYVKWLREVENFGCKEAFLEAGKDCGATDCKFWEKCKGITAPRRRKTGSVTPPQPKKSDDWQPRKAETPAELWQHKAAELVDWAHEQLLAAPDRLAYLAGRGLPLEAVKEYRLGWNPGEVRNGKTGPLFKQRSAWGLEKKWNEESGKWTTVLAIQRGYIIPSFAGETIYRIRIRRSDDDLVVPEGKNKPPKYLFLEGSGKGLVVRDPSALAYLVVESDFDDLLIHWLARDLVCPVALTSCSIRPDADTSPIFSGAVCILNALDYDPRISPKTGKYENPGGQNALWWQKHFPHSERWPVPIGKDPGDAWKEGLDIRKWIIDGLPISLQPKQSAAREEKKTEVPKMGFDQEKMFRLVTDTRSRVQSQCPVGAMDWLAAQTNIWKHRKAADNAVDVAFEAEDEAAVIKALDAWERYHLAAWQRYNERPPVIERQEALFDGTPPPAER
jgi:DNA primase